ncbi:myosin regulatory light chain 10 isoform X1 [Pezoporus occidentalis]|uniref:myosin regulatory light chain 10 isoform X1 n=2 Tax=Pezoporus occidentalis TaxID=407982 RepID=UPI002F9107F7
MPNSLVESGFNPGNLAPKKAKKKIEGGSNVFSMFEQTQIQEFKEAFTIMDQNRDGFIDKADLRDTFAALGRLNVKNEELEAMVKEAPGPINFTVFLTMFGEKLKGTDPEETILNAFKIFDPEGKGHIKADYLPPCVLFYIPWMLEASWSLGQIRNAVSCSKMKMREEYFYFSLMKKVNLVPTPTALLTLDNCFSSSPQQSIMFTY